MDANTWPVQARTPIDAVFFDLDGVLLDTEPLYTRATEEVIAPYGKTFDWTVKAQMMGRDALASARQLVEMLALPISAETFLEKKEPLLASSFPDAPAMPGARALVERLHRAGIRLAVATSSSAHYYALKTERHSWFSLFEVVVCGDHPKVSRPKPAPDIFQAAATLLGVRSHHCLVFEDSPAGVQAAVAAGMQVIAIVDPHLDRQHYPPVLGFIDHFDEIESMGLLAGR
jgi:pseudouridine-5'-monophosphatase